VISILVLFAAIRLAPPWLRQKITWQKAALPYLFRLANAVATIDPKDAIALQSLIEGGAPPAKPPRQVVIGGPIGSGRTSMAAGIGTEFAFKNHKVRYLSLDIA
jgi:pantothenate kinase-related protein Tda10